MFPPGLTKPVRRLLDRYAAGHFLGDQLSRDGRQRFDAAMIVARERLDAADLLARSPTRAESIHVLERALQALDEAVACADQSAPRQGRPPGFVPEDLLRRLQSARERLRTAASVDAELTRADLMGRADAQRVGRRVHSYLGQVMRKRRTVLGRHLAVALLASGLILAAGLAIPHLQDRFEIIASGIYSPVFEAEHAVDGDPGREWLAPEGANGWIELRFARPIDVRAVRVVNAHNPGFDDRATRDLDVELYRKDRLLARAQSRFDHIDPTAAVRIIPVEASGVTRVRFIARTFLGRGAGLAEVEVIEAKPAIH